MIKVIAKVQSVRLGSGVIDVDVELVPTNLPTLTATMTFTNNAGALASQAIGAIKTRVIAFAAAAPYNTTLTAEEILVIGVG